MLAARHRLAIAHRLEKDVHDVANIVLAAQAVYGLRRELDLRTKVLGKFIEEAQAGFGVEVVAANGWAVRVPAQFDGEALGRLLAIVERV